MKTAELYAEDYSDIGWYYILSGLGILSEDYNEFIMDKSVREHLSDPDKKIWDEHREVEVVRPSNTEKPETPEMDHLWDFVEKYYPNYSSCDEIAYEGDLHKIVDEEDEEGSQARKILDRDYEGQRNGQVKYDLDMARKEIYKRAIEGFIQSTQN